MSSFLLALSFAALSAPSAQGAPEGTPTEASPATTTESAPPAADAATSGDASPATTEPEKPHEDTAGDGDMSATPPAMPASMPASMPANARPTPQMPVATVVDYRPTDAARSACDRASPGLAQGPLGLTFQSGVFGAPRRLCPRSDVGLVMRAPIAAEIGRELFIDLVGNVPGPILDALAGREQFYVNAGAGIAVAMAWAPIDDVELFLEVEALRAQFLRGSVTATAVGFGHISPGATVVLSKSFYHAIGVTGRVQLPTATGYYKNSFPFLIDAGAQAMLQPLDSVRFHGYLGGSGGFALGPVSDPRAGLVGVIGAEVLPFDWLSFVADLNTRALYDESLDHIALAVGFRAAVLSTVGLEGGLLIPLAGSERALTAVMMRATWRFGDLSFSKLSSGNVVWDEMLFPAN